MTKLLNLFKLEDSANGIELYRLQVDAIDQFGALFPKVLRDCLISDDKLAALLILPDSPSREELIRGKLPDNAQIMSGDFGEILVLHLLQERESEEAQGVIKWRWKEDKNRSAQKSDVLIYCLRNGLTGHENDSLLISEVKSKSKKRKSNPLSDAVKGAHLDCTQRLAKTLLWAKDNFNHDGEFQKAKEIDRFLRNAVKIPYKKRFRAAAVFDSSLTQEELSKPIEQIAFEDEFGILVVCIPKLSELRSSIFSSALST